jgi:energy-coupling factor transporter ATP-binding protein EcfA2
MGWHDDAVTANDNERTSRATPAAQGAAAAVETLEAARAELAATTLPLAVPEVREARQWIRESLAQLDDYVIPRYRSLDAPLLAVVGGSTGAGKSTLVNALIGYPVTRAGAIRPTTRQPILLHHPLDAEWFEGRRILPGLDRIRGTVSTSPLPAHQAGATPDAQAITSLVLVGHDSVPQGIALLDAPDVDSISDDNRRLAGQLLAAADLWVFVTTANRYADAVPWRLLLDAASRDITVAVVLDRVPPPRRRKSGLTSSQCWTGRGWLRRNSSLSPKVPWIHWECFRRRLQSPCASGLVPWQQMQPGGRTLPDEHSTALSRL